MKTLSEQIKEDLKPTFKVLADASKLYQKILNQRLINKAVKAVNCIALLFILTCANAQKSVNFEEINFLGMTIDQVDVSQKAVPFIRITDKPENGRQLRGFFSPSTGGFKVIFNDKGICNCIMWYTNIDRVLNYNSDLYVVNRMKDKQDPYKVVYTIMVKSLLSIR